VAVDHRLRALEGRWAVNDTVIRKEVLESLK